MPLSGVGIYNTKNRYALAMESGVGNSFLNFESSESRLNDLRWPFTVTNHVRTFSF